MYRWKSLLVELKMTALSCISSVTLGICKLITVLQPGCLCGGTVLPPTSKLPLLLLLLPFTIQCTQLDSEPIMFFAPQPPSDDWWWRWSMLQTSVNKLKKKKTSKKGARMILETICGKLKIITTTINKLLEVQRVNLK